jgi:mRNA interferase MazF
VGAFARGDVVLVPFPFSTSAGEKLRPALVLAPVPYGRYTDYLLCAISTRGGLDPYRVDIDTTDVTGGVLTQTSSIRPTYVVSSSETRIIRKIGEMAGGKVSDALAVLRKFL